VRGRGQLGECPWRFGGGQSEWPRQTAAAAAAAAGDGADDAVALEIPTIEMEEEGRPRRECQQSQARSQSSDVGSD